MQVLYLREDDSNIFPSDICWLSRGPKVEGISYEGYCMNGFRFHSIEVESGSNTQNSGVYVTAETSSYASARDRNLVSSTVTYYGRIQEVIELKYGPDLTFTLFRCLWFDEKISNGIKTDQYGFTLVNFTRSSHNDEPFILSSHAHRCFYIQDLDELEWFVVIKAPLRTTKKTIDGDTFSH